MADDQTNLVDIPLVSCEFCEKRVREGSLTQHGDVSLCQKCSAEWIAEYDACEHDWEDDDHYGRICKKCNGSDNRQLGGAGDEN